MIFGDEAKEEAEAVGHYRATINDNQVRIRKEPNLECDTHSLAGMGDVFDVLGTEGDWLVVEYEGMDGYINVSCADVEFSIDYGETLQEIEDRNPIWIKQKADNFYKTMGNFHKPFPSFGLIHDRNVAPSDNPSLKPIINQRKADHLTSNALANFSCPLVLTILLIIDLRS